MASAALPSTRFDDLTRNIATETLGDVREIIRSTSAAFAARFGGDAEEAEADGLGLYLKAVETHGRGDRGRSIEHSSMSFDKWVRYWVWYGLLDSRKQTARRRRLTPMGSLDERDTLDRAREIDDPAASGCYRMVELLDGLSPDAAEVVRLTLDTPNDIIAATMDRGGSDANLRTCIKVYLRGLGWTLKRVRESFDEVREALVS